MADGFHDFVRELFAGMGRIEVKRFFGGAGAYAGGVMFLLISEDVIYLKADEALQARLGKAGSAPFIWRPKTGRYGGEAVPLGYWRLPEAAMDDPELAVEWGALALAVARAKAASKRKPKRAASKKAAAPKKPAGDKKAPGRKTAPAPKQAARLKQGALPKRAAKRPSAKTAQAPKPAKKRKR